MDSSQAAESIFTEQDFLPLMEEYRRMRKSMKTVQLGAMVGLGVNLMSSFTLRNNAQGKGGFAIMIIVILIVLLAAITPACLKSIKSQRAIKAELRDLSERHNIPFKSVRKQFFQYARAH